MILRQPPRSLGSHKIKRKTVMLTGAPLFFVDGTPDRFSSLAKVLWEFDPGKHSMIDEEHFFGRFSRVNKCKQNLLELNG